MLHLGSGGEDDQLKRTLLLLRDVGSLKGTLAAGGYLRFFAGDGKRGEESRGVIQVKRTKRRLFEV